MAHQWRWQLAQSMEWRWWVYYLGKKDRDIYLRSKGAYWRRVWDQLGLPESAPDWRVLDAGCGPAGLGLIMSGIQVDAVDPLLDIYWSHLNMPRAADFPNVRFHTCTLENYHCPATYDLVFCWNVINHVRDPQTVVANLVNAGRPGATIILSTDVHRREWLASVFRRLPGDVLHPQQYGPAYYQNLLIKNGVQVQSATCWKSSWLFDFMVWKGTLPY